MLAQARVASEVILREAQRRRGPHSRHIDAGRRTSESKPTHRSVAKSARLGRTIAAPVDDDAAESLRKGGRGRGRLARVTAAARGASASPTVGTTREDSDHFIGRPYVSFSQAREAFFWLRSKQLE